MKNIDELETESVGEETTHKKAVNTHKFYLQTKSCVEKIFLFSPKGEFIGPMNKISLDGPSEYKIFNSVGDHSTVTACLVGGRGITNYTFNSLFSIPLDENIIRLLKRNNVEWNNTVVINTPKDDVKFVVLRFPTLWQSMWKIPEYIFLYKISLDKIKLPEHMEGNPSDYFKMGIDPKGDSFISTISLKPPEPVYLDTLDEQSLEKLLQTKIKVECYTQYSKRKMHLNKNGEIVIN